MSGAWVDSEGVLLIELEREQVQLKQETVWCLTVDVYVCVISLSGNACARKWIQRLEMV